jgi:hypothetical protein
MDKACSTHGREDEYIEGFSGKARREETTRKTRHSSGDNIKIDLREIGSGSGYKPLAGCC